jgi:hypothetical protein
MNVFVLPGDFLYYLALLKSYGGDKKMGILILNTHFFDSARLDIKGKMDVVVL